MGEIKNSWRNKNSSKIIFQTMDLKSTIDETILIQLHLAMAVFNEATGRLMEMRDLVRHPDPEIRKRWNTSVANKFGRLMKGIGQKKNNGKSRVGDGYDTFQFIKEKDIPKERKVIYGRF